MYGFNFLWKIEKLFRKKYLITKSKITLDFLGIKDMFFKNFGVYSSLHCFSISLNFLHLARSILKNLNEIIFIPNLIEDCYCPNLVNIHLRATTNLKLFTLKLG